MYISGKLLLSEPKMDCPESKHFLDSPVFFDKYPYRKIAPAMASSKRHRCAKQLNVPKSFSGVTLAMIDFLSFPAIAV